MTTYTRCVPSARVSMTEPYNPFHDMRDNHPDVEFALVKDLPASLGGAAIFPQPGGWWALLVDRAEHRVVRKAKTTHELRHKARGGGVEVEGMPTQWLAVRARDEKAVEDEVARLHVPAEPLAQLVASICDDGTPVMAWETRRRSTAPTTSPNARATF